MKKIVKQQQKIVQIHCNKTHSPFQQKSQTVTTTNNVSATIRKGLNNNFFPQIHLQHISLPILSNTTNDYNKQKHEFAIFKKKI